MSRYPDGVSDRDIDRIYGSRRNTYAIIVYCPDYDLEDIFYLSDADADDLANEIERLESEGYEIVDAVIEDEPYDDY